MRENSRISTLCGSRILVFPPKCETSEIFPHFKNFTWNQFTVQLFRKKITLTQCGSDGSFTITIFTNIFGNFLLNWSKLLNVLILERRPLLVKLSLLNFCATLCKVSQLILEQGLNYNWALKTLQSIANHKRNFLQSLPNLELNYLLYIHCSKQNYLVLLKFGC